MVIRGKVDKELAEQVIQAMTPKVQWARAGAWELYDICAFLKSSGDDLWRAGFKDAAYRNYTNIGDWVIQSFKTN